MLHAFHAAVTYFPTTDTRRHTCSSMRQVEEFAGDSALAALDCVGYRRLVNQGDSIQGSL